jgi:hypothetical protein
LPVPLGPNKKKLPGGFFKKRGNSIKLSLNFTECPLFCNLKFL